MSEKKATEYYCDGHGCDFKSTDPHDFRRVIGNIIIPGRGGLIGNNIFVNDKEDSENAACRKFYCASDDNTVRFYHMDYCLKCMVEILKLNK